MKIVLIILSVLIVAFIILFVILGFISNNGKAIGLADGRLSKCPNKPNCVCTEHNQDTAHYVEPIIITQGTEIDVLSNLKHVIKDMQGSIQAESDTYLAATFTSPLFRFVDDLEIRLDMEQKLIHIRSASRVGYSDAGVNKSRAELLKKRYDAQIKLKTTEN